MRRLCYEGLLLAAVVLLAGFLTLPATRAGTPQAGLALPPLPARVFSACLVFTAAGLYFIGFWTGGRRTLPMKTWRLALVRADGRAVDAKTAVVRYLGAWIGPVASLAAYSALHPAGLGAHAAWLLAIGYVWPLVDPRPAIPARPDRGNAHRHGVGGSFVCRASATPTLISAMPGESERIERLAEQEPRHDSRHGGNEKEQAPRHSTRRRAAAANRAG